MKNPIEIILKIEQAHFRTNHDTGANQHAMIVMNSFRGQLNLPFITPEDLPSWDGKSYVMPKDSLLLSNLNSAAIKLIKSFLSL